MQILDAGGTPVSDPDTLARIRALAIPPAWRDVWISPDPRGHLQATGIDAAGRKQYRYHDDWRLRRDREKFEDMLLFARALPRLRRRVRRDLRRPELDRERIAACAVRLLDIGFFRVGSEDYASHGGGRGLTTILRSQVTVRAESLVFDYTAKAGLRRVQTIADPEIHELVAQLRRRRGGPPELLAYRDGSGWAGLHADEVNAYLKLGTGGEHSAKDFRTWNATVIAALALAYQGAGASTTARRRHINAAVKGVAVYLGNTPAVARASYIDPRVFDRYLSGWTIAGALRTIAGEPDLTDWPARRRLEEATLDLLTEETSSPALERVAA